LSQISSHQSPSQLTRELAKIQRKEISRFFWIVTLPFLKIVNIPLWFHKHTNKKDGAGLGLGL
jgi:hypothetical protein